MQKITKNSVFSLIIRGIIVGMVSLTVFLSGLYAAVVYAQQDPGGRFWQILNAILLSGNWQQPGDGTVKNAQKLWGIEADAFLRAQNKEFKCPENQCVTGFHKNGTLICQ